MKDKRRWAGMIVLLLAVLCIGIVIYYEVGKTDRENVYAKLQSQVADSIEDSAAGIGYICPIDFDKLRETNEDIYAWIDIPDTAISYPVVQSDEDDSYYLDHTIDGQEGYPGSIYTERYNLKDFSDFNTVIYGHNMRDGSMFQSLHEYEEDGYLEEHPCVVIYMPEQKLTYRIFAVVVYSDIHILESYDFSDAAQRQLYLDSIYSCRGMTNRFDETVEVDTDSRILTLSTCIGGQPDKRLLVEAVLIDE